MSQISKLVETIRELINDPRRRAAIRQNDEDWQRLCRSLDAIGDTEMALEAYGQIPDSAPPGSSYILVYGFLQALFIQQDAVNDLRRALNKQDESNDPELLEAREVRHAVTHQTDGRYGEFRLIGQSTLTKCGFALVRKKIGEEEDEVQYVWLQELLEKQRTPHERALQRLIEALCKEEIEYRERFRDEPLAGVFPTNLDYYFEKLDEAACGNESWEFGTLHINLIREVVEQFQAALAKRQVTGVYENIEHLIDQITYPLEQLTQFFEAQGKGRLNARDAVIHIAFVQCKVARLRKAAREIDAEIAGPLEICSNRASAD